MAHINLDIFARLHERTLRRTEQDAQKRFQHLGQQAADELTKGIATAAPRIRRAMNSAADATVDYTRRSRDLTKVQREQAANASRIANIEYGISEQRDRGARLTQEAAKQETSLKDARKAAAAQGRAIQTRENNLKTKREAHAKTVEKLRLEELKLKDVRLSGDSKKAKDYDKGLQDLRKQNAREAGEIRRKELELGRARDELGKRTSVVTGVEEDLDSVRKESVGNLRDLDSSEQDLVKTREAVARADTQILHLNEDVVRSNRKREESIRRLSEAEEDHEKKSSGNGGRRKGGGGAGVLGNMLTDLPFVPSGRAGAAIGGGMLVGMASGAQALVTASQSLAVLPAILAAAGAGMATLVLGTHGFADAIQNMGDPKKFAEALQGLSPAAQQAALEIQHLVDGPLGDLQNATQDALFKGVAEQLHNLTNQFAPELKGLTTGIAGSFNNMFGNAVGQLMTPETSGSIDAIINNIVTAFQHLEPAVAPFVDAMTKLTQTGSNFLPGFADAISNAANSFNSFITEAQKNGSLQDFIQKGIDAAVMLGHFLWDLGKQIFDVFGNKEPGQFKQTLEDMAATAMGVMQAIVGISHVVNDLLSAIQPIAEAMGGWESLVQKAGAAFLLWKTADVLTSLGSMGGLIDGLPGKAGGAAAGINKAFAAIAVPAAIYTILNTLAQMQHQDWAQQSQDRRVTDARAQDMGLKPQQPGVGDFLGPPRPGQSGAAAPTPTPLTQQLRDGIAKGQMPGYSLAPDGSIIGPGGAKVNLPGELTAPRVQGPPMPDGSVFGSAPGSAGPPSPTAGLPPYSPFDVPSPPPEAGAGGVSGRKDAILGSLGDPSQFMPDLGVTPPPAIGAPNLQYGNNGDPFAKNGYGYQNVDPRAVNDAFADVQNQAIDVRDARMDLKAVEQLANEGLQTQLDVLHAKEKADEEERQFHNAQLDYQEALSGKWKKVGNSVSSSMGTLGANLDRDLGISKGLSGLADNLVRFLGNLATAPLQAMLQQQINNNPNEGSGLIGIAAAQGAFGQQFTPQGIAAGGGQTGNGSFLSNGANSYVNSYGASGGGYPGDAALLSNVPAPATKGYNNETKNLALGLADCSSAVEDLVNMIDGKPTAGGSLTTHNAASLLPGMGFQQGMGGPGDFRVGYNSGHMQATLPGGTPFNWGSDAAAARGGVGGTGADDPSFTDHWFRSLGGGGAPGAAPTSATSSGGGGIAAPPGASPAVADILSRMPPGAPAPGATPLSMPMGGPQAAPIGYQPTQQAAAPQGWQASGGGGGGGGGLLGAAAGAAAGMFPGGGAAAQIAMQMIQRTVKFGGEVAGSLAKGAMDAVSVSDPDGGPGASIGDSWLGRLAGSVASAAPALPNAAGGNQSQQPQGGVPQNGQQGPQGPGGGVNIQNMHVQADKATGQSMANELSYASYAAGFTGM